MTLLLNILGICYGAGAILHILDVFDLRLQFSSMTVIWQVWTIFLVGFDAIAATGLFLKKSWGEVFFLIVALSQLIAYSFFKKIFGEQQFLIFFHVASLAIYIWFKIQLNRSYKTSRIDVGAKNI